MWWDGMAEQCPECGTPVGGDPWCGNCGAHVAETTSSGAAASLRPRWVGPVVVPVLLALAVLAVVSRGGDDDVPASEVATPVVPVEEQTVLPPRPPPAPASVQRQFAAEGRVVGERPRGADDPLVPPPDDLVFTAADGTVDVDVDGTDLLGLVEGTVVWRRSFPTALSVPPVRTGTSVLVALVDGTLASLDPGDGDVWWEVRLDGVPTAAASDVTLLLVGTADGHLLRLDPSGTVVTRTELGPGAVEHVVVGRPATVVLPDRVVEVAVDG